MARTLPALALLVAIALPAFPHGGGVLDLEGIEVLVEERADLVTGAKRRHYVALRRVLGREIRRPLLDDLKKLDAVAAACTTSLTADTELRDLLDAALAGADPELAGEPQDAAALASRLERAKDRARVLGAADRADGERAAGVAFAAGGDPVRAVRAFRRAAEGFARAETTGAALLRRQIRRGAPGQPLPRGTKGAIATYVGTGASGFDPGPRPARGASFYFPTDVEIDPLTGLLHVVDLNNNQIRRLDADGNVRAVAGTGELGDSVGPALAARLHHPTSIAFHPQTGDLHVATWHASRVLRLDRATGALSYVAGSGELGFDGDGGDALAAVTDYPVNLVFTPDGSWFLADQGNRRVRFVDAATNVITTVAGTGARGFAGDDGPAKDAAFDLPSGDLAEPAGRVALDPTARWLYVADTDNHRVRRIDLDDPLLTITTFAGTGVAGYDGDGGAARSAQLRAPVDVECDAQGNVFVCERDNAVVRRIDRATGVITTVAGSGVAGYAGDGGLATSARLDAPQGICIDRVRGRLYIADTLNHVVRVVWE